MTESVEVRPRFMDSDLQESPAPPVESQTQAVATAARGLFTSMYENKIIVLIIIITIIVIAFVAYFVFRKDPETNTQQVYTNHPKQIDQKPAQVEPTGGAPSQSPAEETAGKPSHTELVKKADPAALKELLNRSKTASRPTENVGEETTITQSKTDSEVMELMEDDDQNDNVAETEDFGGRAETQDESELNSESDNENNETVDENIALDFTDSGSTCSAMLQSGRQCKNRVKAGGKCAKHSG
jgi:hypothetical protein